MAGQMSSSCYCTGRCTDGRGCAAFPHGRQVQTAWPVGRAEARPLTEADVRRVIREALGGNVGINARWLTETVVAALRGQS